MEIKRKKFYGYKNISHINGKANDEFYTLREDVENIIDTYEPFIKGKKIYCNCDGEESEFVKVLKERNYDVVYTNDDYKNHLNEYNDRIVITNPPWHCFSQYLRDILDNYKDCIVIGSVQGVKNKYTCNNMKKYASKIFNYYTNINYFYNPVRGKCHVTGICYSTFKMHRTKDIIEKYGIRETYPITVLWDNYNLDNYDIDVIPTTFQVILKPKEDTTNE